MASYQVADGSHRSWAMIAALHCQVFDTCRLLEMEFDPKRWLSALMTECGRQPHVAIAAQDAAVAHHHRDLRSASAAVQKSHWSARCVRWYAAAFRPHG